MPKFWKPLFALLPIAAVLWAGDVLAADPAATDLVGENAPDLFSAGIKMSGALVLMIGGIFLVLYLLRRAGAARKGLFGGREIIRVLATRALAPKQYIAVVEVGDRVLTLGVSPDGIACLDKTPAARFHAGSPKDSAPTDKPFLRALRKSEETLSGEVDGRS